MDTVLDLFTRPDFQIGLVYGVIGSVIMLGSLTVKDLPSRLAGPISVCLLLIAVFVGLGQRLSLAVGTVAMVIAGFLWHRSRTIAVMVAVLGGSLVMYRSISEPAALWIRPLGLAALLLIGWRLMRYEEADSSPRSALLLALTLFAIWANVPETKIPRLLLGGWMGLLPGLAAVGWPKLGWWASGLATPIVWMTAVSGAARPGSIIGGWASMGILLLRPSPSIKPWQAVLVHAGLIALTARVAGFRESPLEAGAISLAGFVIASRFLWLLTPKNERAQAIPRRGGFER